MGWAREKARPRGEVMETEAGRKTDALRILLPRRIDESRSKQKSRRNISRLNPFRTKKCVLELDNLFEVRNSFKLCNICTSFTVFSNLEAPYCSYDHCTFTQRKRILRSKFADAITVCCVAS